MKFKALNFLLLAPLFLFSGNTQAQEIEQMPKGWLKAGSKPSEYKIGIDKQNFYSNKSSMYIEGTTDTDKDFGTVMQSFSASKYSGKRLKLSAYLKSKDWKGWAGIWLRADDSNNKSVSFDNTANRGITGTTDWKVQEIVLDIPQNTKTIALGVLASGKGMVWADNIKLDIVDQTTPVTNNN